MRFLFSSSRRQGFRFRAQPMKRLTLFLFLACTFASISFAQAPGGSIIGKVSESHAGPLAGARVTVTNTQTHAATNVASDANGQFTVENLPVGDYRVTIAANGLVPQDKDVKVKAGHKSKLSATLKEPPPPRPPK
jgi:uncharacterized surface anchored protein